jgi:pimeloyl-ACP methyl ester carboxylesterase
VKPFYFGDSGRPLYGVHHPPARPGGAFGVVVCPPFGQEALRAHRSLRELASRLAETGTEALRFDYHGSGDSAGEPDEAQFEEWVVDTAAAVAEMREARGDARVALVGLRLGAAVAALCAERLGGIEALVMWEPVVDGARHLAELRAAHAEWIRDHAPGARLSTDEVLGFALPGAFAAGLAALRLECVARAPARRTLLLTSAGQDERDALWRGQPSVEHRRVEPAPVWLHAEGMSRVLVPGSLLAAIVAWLAKGSSTNQGAEVRA